MAGIFFKILYIIYSSYLFWLLFFFLDPEKEFPSMGELQSSLLCESGSDEAIVTACQALLFYALYDPGVSGPYVRNYSRQFSWLDWAKEGDKPVNQNISEGVLWGRFLSFWMWRVFCLFIF